MEQLLSTREAAQFLGVTTRTIRKWKQLGKIVPRKSELGKDFYAEEQLGNFLKTNSQVPKFLKTNNQEKFLKSNSQEFVPNVPNAVPRNVSPVPPYELSPLSPVQTKGEIEKMTVINLDAIGWQTVTVEKSGDDEQKNNAPVDADAAIIPATNAITIAGDVQSRIAEAEKLGFTDIIIPKRNSNALKGKKYSIRIHPVSKVEEAIRTLFS